MQQGNTEKLGFKQIIIIIIIIIESYTESTMKKN